MSGLRAKVYATKVEGVEVLIKLRMERKLLFNRKLNLVIIGNV